MTNVPRSCFEDVLNKIGSGSIGVESLENFEIKCVKFYCLILSSELIETDFRSFAIIPERAFLT